MSLNMQGPRFIRTTLSLFLAAALCLATGLQAQSSTEHHGRKYKAPPETTRIEVHVTKKSNGKPIMNAAVVFNPTKDGKDLGSMEVKTDPDGKAALDIIPVGSIVRVQVIASGFATYAEDYTLDSPRSIDVVLLRPQEQVSSYLDNSGKESARKPGVQEPVRPGSPSTTAKPDDKSGTAPKPQ